MKPRVCANCKFFAVAGSQEAPVFICAAHCDWKVLDEPTRHQCLKDFDWSDNAQYELKEQPETETKNENLDGIHDEAGTGEQEFEESAEQGEPGN